MAEEGNVSVEGSALVDVEEELVNLQNNTPALTQMVQTVLQLLDMMESCQSGTSGQVVDCTESSASDDAPGT